MAIGSFAGTLNVSNRSQLINRTRYLSNISTDLGNITAGKIRGVEIRGSVIIGTVIKTAPTGSRVVLTGSSIQIYNASNVLVAEMGGNVLGYINSDTAIIDALTSVTVDAQSVITGVVVSPSSNRKTTVWTGIHGTTGARIGLDLDAETAATAVMYVSSGNLSGTNFLQFDTDGLVVLAGRSLYFGGKGSNDVKLVKNGNNTVEIQKGNSAALGNLNLNRIGIGVLTNDSGDPVYIGVDANNAVQLMDVASSSDALHAAGTISRRARGSQSARSNVTDGDRLAFFHGQAWSASYWGVAEIDIVVDGTVTNNQRPGSKIVFTSNTPNASPANNMVLRGDGGLDLLQGKIYLVGRGTNDVLLKKDGTLTLSIRSGDDDEYAAVNCADLTAAGTIVGTTIQAGDGFTGTGAYTNFTFADGICTNAS